MREYDVSVEGSEESPGGLFQKSPYEPGVWWARFKAPTRTFAREAGKNLQRRFPDNRVTVFVDCGDFGRLVYDGRARVATET